MTVSATEGVGMVPQPASASTPTRAEMDKDLFLKLMVAQLRNQDPMNPMDSTQFLAQSAQFTTLEKLTEVAEFTAQTYAAQMAFGASTLAGKEVTYLDADGAEVTGTVDSVRFTGAGPMLTIDDAEVSMNSVVGVVAPTTGTGTDTDTKTDTGETSTDTSTETGSSPATT
jgi:flagellar basal-body rod modification protein FlgD